MPTTPLVLILTPRAGNFDLICRAVSESGCRCEARRANDMPAALARMAGGGIRLVLVDSSGGADYALTLDSVRKFSASAPELPVLVWSDSEDSNLAAEASLAGAKGWVTKSGSPQEFARLLAGLLPVEPSAAPRTIEALPAPARATVIAVMGVKGGVGATTVAMNVAAALTSRGSVILAEIRPAFGSLHAYFNPGRGIQGFTKWRAGGEGGRTNGTTTSVLWPVPTVAGLSVLFGPQISESPGDIAAARAGWMLRALATETDFVVVDLPASLSEANRAILGMSHYLTLVVAPVPTCMRLGKLMLEAIQGWEKAPGSVGAVVVKQGWEGAAVPLEETEAELDVPILGVVPPAAELRLQGERKRIPMMQCDPESLLADSFVKLASRFPLQKMPAVARGAMGEVGNSQ